jgi:hypothetical protein
MYNFSEVFFHCLCGEGVGDAAVGLGTENAVVLSLAPQVPIGPDIMRFLDDCGLYGSIASPIACDLVVLFRRAEYLKIALRRHHSQSGQPLLVKEDDICMLIFRKCLQPISSS